MTAKRPSRSRRPPARSPREAALEADIAAIEAVAVAAEGTRDDDPDARPVDLRAAVAARDKVTSYRQDLHRLRSVAEANALTDPLVRYAALRRVCEQDGSWVAAGKYLAEETRLRIALVEAETARRNAEMEDATDDEVVSQIEDAMPDLPIAFVQRIARAAWKRFGGELPAELADRPAVRARGRPK
jgi:hypothetical protein